MQGPRNFGECVEWACLKFQELFSSNIKQLLFNFPRDSVTSSGTPFWSGPKRAPSPIELNVEDERHLQFIWAAANLRAFIYGLEADLDVSGVKEAAGRVILPEFVPKTGLKIAAIESEVPTISANTNVDECQQLSDQLKRAGKASIVGGGLLQPHDFEKDDDRNHHIDFVTACANLRAINYEITPADRHHVKLIAGKIIPAIATTTALVAGLVALELYKVLDGPRGDKNVLDEVFMKHWNLDRFKNGFVNLALPFFAFSSPLPAPKFSYNAGRTHFTLWDSFRVNLSECRDLTALLAKIRDDCDGLAATMISAGPSLLYSAYMAKTTVPERMSMPLDQLISMVSKKALPEHVDVITLEALCENPEGEDVEFPYITLYLKK